MPTAVASLAPVLLAPAAEAGKTGAAPRRCPHGPDHTALLSYTSRLRPESAIRSLFPAESTPGMLSLLAGKPNVDMFPFANIALELKPVGAEAPTTLNIRGADLEAALQYGQTFGLPRLVEWIVQWQVRMHGRAVVPPTAPAHDGLHPWRVTVGNGSQDLLTKTFNALLNPGDSVLAECPAYTGILPTLASLQANVVAVESDAEGLMPASLERILAGWATDPQTAPYAFPKLIYTTPTAANPSGTTAGEARKRAVLAIARRHGVLIMEDDPYMLLDFQGLDCGVPPETRRHIRTYWSLEQDEAAQWGTGWVLRFDSFSKIIAGGIRVGYMTGPKVVVDAVDLESSSANLQGSGASQAIVLALLEHWGQDGLLRHCHRVATFYRNRRDHFEAHARRILGPQPDGRPAVATWTTPVAGMFLWLRLCLPPVDVKGGEQGDSYRLVTDKARARGVLAVPGVAFMPDGQCTSYVRTSFSIIAEDDVAEALTRLRAAVEEAWEEQGVAKHA